MKLWRCPPASTKTFGDCQWWCGDPWVTLPCTGDDTHFFNYTSGTFGTALAASTLSSPVNASGKGDTLSSASSSHTSTEAAALISTPTGAASTHHPFINTSLSNQSQPQSSRMPTALGAGIGSALGILIIGCFLVFLYARRRKLNHEKEPISSSQNSNLKDDIDGLPIELRDTQRPHETESNRRNEMPGTKAKIVPIFDM